MSAGKQQLSKAHNPLPVCSLDLSHCSPISSFANLHQMHIAGDSPQQKRPEKLLDDWRQCSDAVYRQLGLQEGPELGDGAPWKGKQNQTRFCSCRALLLTQLLSFPPSAPSSATSSMACQARVSISACYLWKSFILAASPTQQPHHTGMVAVLVAYNWRLIE
jgi:hypothetical protein